METKLWRMPADRPNPEMIEEAAAFLRAGEVIAFPTETVYGLGANALDSEALKKIYQAKGRPDDNPLIIHISDLDQIVELVDYIAPLAKDLMHNFWPGPLTLVLTKSQLVPSLVTGGLNTVAIRMPSHPIALSLLAAVGLPIAAPSANLSGRPSPTEAAHVWQDLEGKIAGLIDGGPTWVGVESTVLDLSGTVPTILRPGGVSLEELRVFLGKVESDPSLRNQALAPKSPGMKYIHYSPVAPAYLLIGDLKEIADKFLSILKKDKNCGLMISEEIYEMIKEALPPNQKVVVLGSRQKLSFVAANLFAALRQLDTSGAKTIYIEAFAEEGIGQAIMNRLYKATGGKTI